jgi:hypothetical protein
MQKVMRNNIQVWFGELLQIAKLLDMSVRLVAMG